MAQQLNSSDLFSVEQLTSHFKVYAGPGSGKTHFLVQNIKNIVSSHPAIVGAKKRSILCITYTNAAVSEIVSRLHNYQNYVKIYTIHGFIIEHIIKPYQSELKKIMLSDFGIEISKRTKISSQVEGLSVLHGHSREDIYEYLKSQLHTEEELEYSKSSMAKIAVDIASYSENETMKLDLPMAKGKSKVDEKHVKLIKKYTWDKAGKLTHDEILYFGHRLATSNSTISYALRVQFPFIFVDEFQDTSPLQSLLIEYLGRQSSIVGVIGDVAQSIYSFQGARPSKFLDFGSNGLGGAVSEYEIQGNRRSTCNIVSFINFLRQSDTLEQVSTREYDSQELKDIAESKKVFFLLGESLAIKEKIREVVKDGGVVLTRAWAGAFNYMEDIPDEQKQFLRKLYNKYYMQPIDIRYEITEHKNVSWVRAFEFIHNLWEAYKNKSVADILKSLSLYHDTKKLIKKRKLDPNFVLLFSRLVNELFSSNPIQTTAVQVIKNYNNLLNSEVYNSLNDMIALSKENEETTLNISIFTEYDDDELRELISRIHWNTSFELFKNVFSHDSKYMTVHQAKGLEWRKVIVSVEPTKNDETTIADLISNPAIMNETAQDEFTRIFYVGCSRAKEELYIHLKDTKIATIVEQSLSKFVSQKGKGTSFYTLLT